jgi:hypothetical protein
VKLQQALSRGTMLSALVKEHQAKQSVSQVREICEANRKDALAATETYVNVATNTVNEEVAQVYAAQKKLEKEVKGLQTNTAHFGKQTMQWLDMIREFNGSLTVALRPRAEFLPCLGDVSSG